MSQDKIPSFLNPLWIISIFLGTTELCVTTAAALTDGPVQLIFAIFGVAFATGVAFMFFLILWQKNHVLYAPRDFQASSSPEEFVQAMRSSEDRLRLMQLELTRRDQVAEEAAREETVEFLTKLSNSGQVNFRGPEIAQAADSVLLGIRRARAQSEIRVDLSGINSNFKHPLSITVDNDTRVQEVMDSIYFALEGEVRPYTYGRAWVLVDSNTGKAYAELGSNWADPEEGDQRKIVDAGLHPGIRLRAVWRTLGPPRPQGERS